MSEKRKMLSISTYALLDMLRSNSCFGVILDPLPRDSVPVGLNIEEPSTIQVLCESASFEALEDGEEAPPIEKLPKFLSVQAVHVFTEDGNIKGIFPVGVDISQVIEEHPEWDVDEHLFNRLPTEVSEGWSNS